MTHYFFIKYRYPKGAWQVDSGIYSSEKLAKAAVTARKDRFNLSEEVRICKCYRRIT